MASNASQEDLHSHQHLSAGEIQKPQVQFTSTLSCFSVLKELGLPHCTPRLTGLEEEVAAFLLASKHEEKGSAPVMKNQSACTQPKCLLQPWGHQAITPRFVADDRSDTFSSEPQHSLAGLLWLKCQPVHCQPFTDPGGLGTEDRIYLSLDQTFIFGSILTHVLAQNT